MKRLCLLLALIMVTASGCFPMTGAKSTNIKLYYALKGNAGMGAENRVIEYTDEKSKYEKTLEELISGPSDTGKFETGISKDTKVLGVNAENGNLTVDFSKEFDTFSGILHKESVVASVVDTMLEFDEIKKVRILVEGQELIAPDGTPYGFMEFIDYSAENLAEKEITLYFADSQAMYLVPEKRTVYIRKDMGDDDFYRAVLEELIKGPRTENLYATIPEEVKVEYVKLDGDILKVDFSEEMHTKHWGGAAGEAMTVNSIVNTMTEFEEIKRVMPSVDGGPLSIEHMIIEEPLERNESIIFIYN